MAFHCDFQEDIVSPKKGPPVHMWTSNAKSLTYTPVHTHSHILFPARLSDLTEEPLELPVSGVREKVSSLPGPPLSPSQSPWKP